MRKYCALLWRALKSPFGVFGVMLTFAKPLKWGVEWMGDLDFVVTNWPKVLEFLETGAGTTTTVIVGALIVAYSLYNSAQEVPEQTMQKTERVKPRGRWYQTEAITDDNPEGTWEFIGPTPEPNYAVWGKRQSLMIFEAAKIMAGIPPTEPDTPQSKEYEGLLKDATAQAKIGRSDKTADQHEKAVAHANVYGGPRGQTLHITRR